MQVVCIFQRLFCHLSSLERWLTSTCSSLVKRNGISAHDCFDRIYLLGLEDESSKSVSNFFTRRGLFESKMLMILNDLNRAIESHPNVIWLRFNKAAIYSILAKSDLLNEEIANINKLFDSNPALLDDQLIHCIYMC
ncbi:hypothetical protein PPL_00644 [Heterostelium album PN500]|uniref:Uncharacterized protein n=1 Tax=Heterostelium pallidum (strain ATCC 26659 / Pp 5 / PN500) TaxID=670386 RepID=D3AX16_HETP5|nr:hypothetical protein PPL_00644 [Heterostelium album PN500]EFA86839.1 hypothetical protein PPL_00644 [Heterostelium album PN500]|eukprot:XP_020438942.1 hypothetical protein PPL_00644 [Heterostelium album PN500]